MMERRPLRNLLVGILGRDIELIIIGGIIVAVIVGGAVWLLRPAGKTKQVKGKVINVTESRYWMGTPKYGYWVTTYIYTIETDEPKTRKHQEAQPQRFGVGDSVVCTIDVEKDAIVFIREA